VFHALVDPADLRRWWRMTPHHTTPFADVEVRPGGTYRLGMTGPSGTTYVVEGVFRDVDPPARLAYTWRWTAPQESPESAVTIELRDDGGATEVVVRHADLAGEPERRAHEAAWTGCLGMLERLLGEAG
jgi:uncharacterized protein YndB with AHSA1/START domain